MAFPHQRSIVQFDRAERFALEPLTGSFADAFTKWRVVRQNRRYLLETLPGVVYGNRTPISAQRSNRRFASPEAKKEGYFIIDEKTMSCQGLATLLQDTRPELGRGYGIEVDYWLNPRMSGREHVAPQIGKHLIQRAQAITSDLGLQLPPFALLDPRNLDSDSSRELAELMIRVGPEMNRIVSPNFNGVNDRRYDVYRVFEPVQTKN